MLKPESNNKPDPEERLPLQLSGQLLQYLENNKIPQDFHAPNGSDRIVLIPRAASRLIGKESSESLAVYSPKESTGDDTPKSNTNIQKPDATQDVHDSTTEIHEYDLENVPHDRKHESLCNNVHTLSAGVGQIIPSPDNNLNIV